MADVAPAAARLRKGTWWHWLLIGLLLYLVGVFLLAFTKNPNLFPTVVMLGSFMVPASYVAFFYERRHLSEISMSTTVLTFLWGGLVGVFAASLLEPIIIHGMSPANAMLVGLIEEAVKILGILLIARTRPHDSMLDGLVLGAAAGMGFAALESMGYAFSAFLKSGGSLSASVAITLMRGVLSPVGHGTWTALFTAILFRDGTIRHFRISRAVIGAYLLVSLLHGLWDGLPMVLTEVFGNGPAVLLGQVLVGGTGIVMLIWRWRQARQRQDSEAAQPLTDEPAG